MDACEDGQEHCRLNVEGIGSICNSWKSNCHTCCGTWYQREPEQLHQRDGIGATMSPSDNNGNIDAIKPPLDQQQRHQWQHLQHTETDCGNKKYVYQHKEPAHNNCSNGYHNKSWSDRARTHMRPNPNTYLRFLS